MYRGSDSVFRHSLVGIAFILVFFLLIIFGRLYSDANVARTEALARLEQRQQQDALPLAREAFESARQELHTRLAEEGVNAEAVIRGLLDKTQAEAELTTLKQRVQELGAQLAGFTEIKEMLAQASKSSTLSGTSEEALLSAVELRARLEQKLRSAPGQSATALTDSEISGQALAAIEFKRNIESMLEQELGQALIPGQETTWAQWLVDSQLLKSAGRAPGRIVGGDPRTQVGQENNALHSQIAFLRNRLATHNDHTVPPCWFDETGKVQFLLTLELKSGSVIVTSAWLPAREADARAIPGLDRLLSRGPLTHAAFNERARSVAQHSGKQCHYSVQVKDNMRDGMRSERLHQQLETLFHLVDIPR